MEIPPPNGLITLLTDFGHRDPYVGIMKGVAKRHFMGAEVIDVCHDVPAQDVATAALFIAGMHEHFPVGTVHVVVVDPGVGTERRAIAVCVGGAYWIAPDNGVLEAVLADVAASGEVRALDLDALGLAPRSRTFHGRDVFTPAAAMLAGRRYGFRALGPRIADVQRGSTGIGRSEVLVIDRFGNLITGVTAAVLTERSVTAVRVAGRRLPLCGTYGEVAAGEPLALVNSYDLLEIAVRDGSAADRLGLGRGTVVELLAEEP